MRVIATADGFYNKFIKDGEEFEVPSDMSGSWFKPLKGKGKQADPEPGNTEPEKTE